MFSFFKNKPELQESSMTLGMEDLEPFLQRVANLIPRGFGQTEISQVMRTAKGMALDEEQSMEFSIEFEGKRSTFIVEIFMDDIDTPDPYFFAPPALATAIGQEYVLFSEERGM